MNRTPQYCRRDGDSPFDPGGVPDLDPVPFSDDLSDSFSSLDFPATQQDIAAVCGLSAAAVSTKFKALAEIHGDREIFVMTYEGKRISRQGFQRLRDLIDCKNVCAYRAKVDADRRVQAAQSQVEPPRSPQFPQSGTSYDIAAIPVPTLVPGRSIPGGYSGPLGLPVAPTQSLGYYQPTDLAQRGAGAAIAAQQLVEMLAEAVNGDQARGNEELEAIRSQRAQVAAATARLRALVSAGIANQAQVAVAIGQEKNALASEMQALASLAQTAGVSLEGLGL